MADTWDYSSPIDTKKPEDLPDSYVWERLRIRRDAFLSASDWRMVIDTPWSKEPWAAYRQALRDLPQNTSDPRQAIWPKPPTE